MAMTGRAGQDLNENEPLLTSEPRGAQQCRAETPLRAQSDRLRPAEPSLSIRNVARFSHSWSGFGFAQGNLLLLLGLRKRVSSDGWHCCDLAQAVIVGTSLSWKHGWPGEEHR
jgi:hypothetical protein